MEQSNINFTKYEKIKLFFLSFMAIFLLAFSMLYGSFEAYRDYTQDLKQNNNNSQIIDKKDIEVKKANISEPFSITESIGETYLGSSHSNSFFLSYTSILSVDSMANFTGISFNLVLVSYDIGFFEYELIFSDRMTLTFDEQGWGALPSPVFNRNFTYSFELVQYQDTGYYVLRCTLDIEDLVPGTESESRNYSFSADTTLLHLNPDLRPFDVHLYSYSTSFEYLSNFSSIVVDNAYDLGYSRGFDDGESQGYENGFTDGELQGSGGDTTNNAFSYIWSMITNATNSVLNIFNFNILPGLPLYAVISVPIIISILFFVLKVVKK